MGTPHPPPHPHPCPACWKRPRTEVNSRHGSSLVVSTEHHCEMLVFSCSNGLMEIIIIGKKKTYSQPDWTCWLTGNMFSTANKNTFFQNYNELFQWYLSCSYSDVQTTSGEGNKQAGIKRLWHTWDCKQPRMGNKSDTIVIFTSTWMVVAWPSG